MAICVKCKVQQSTESFVCVKCEQEKSHADFDPRVLKRSEESAKKCLDCQMPACRVCNCRPTRPLQGPEAELETGSYRCLNCTYPACMAGCGKPRPHAKIYSVDRIPKWTCKDCQPRCNAGCGKERPKGWQYGVHVMPLWTCPECLGSQKAEKKRDSSDGVSPENKRCKRGKQ